MNMVRLIYVSRMTEQCDMEGIQKILDVSRMRNVSAQITGILCYDPRFFLQCLEGPKAAVNALYNKILRDDRHTDVLLLEYSDVNERTFGSWSMGFLKSSEINPETLAEFSKDGKFNPFLFRGERARDFLVTIATQERTRLQVQVVEA